MGRAKCFLTYSCLALAMRCVLVNSVALQMRNAVAKRCVLADLYTWFIYDTLYIRLKLAGSSHILTKFMNAQRRTALIFVTEGVGRASCMCDWGIRHGLYSAALFPSTTKSESPRSQVNSNRVARDHHEINACSSVDNYLDFIEICTFTFQDDLEINF